jgi:thiol-disulfide isomerase/thioredoxin
MKNYILILLIISITTVSFVRTPKKVEIEGIISNAVGKTLYLNAFINNTPIIIDSVVVKKEGKFKLAFNVLKPDFYSIGFSKQDYALLVLDDSNAGETIKFYADGLKIMETYSISGSKDSEIVKTLVLHLSDHSKWKKKYGNILKDPTFTPQQKADSKIKLDSLDKNFIYKRDQFINKNYKSLAVLTAVGYLNPQTDLALYKKIEEGLAETVPNTEYHIAVQTQIKQIETQNGIRKEEEEERKRLEQLSTIGSIAPELNFSNPDGEIITLESLHGKYVLIDFWASWCRPCRAENPNVVKLYSEYKEKGFTVYSVSLDNDKNRWLEAIKQDNLYWPNHVSDLKQWRSEAVKIYGFTGIPFTVLIDENGEIIAKNLRGSTLENKIKELLGD